MNHLLDLIWEHAQECAWPQLYMDLVALGSTVLLALLIAQHFKI